MPKPYLLVLAALGTLALLVGASADPGEPDRHERRDRDGVWPCPGLSDRHRHLPGPDRLRWRHDHDSGQSSQSAASMTNWPAAWPNELAAMAAAAGVEQAALAYGNCFLDLGNAKAGCRSLVVATNNLFLHNHNLDWGQPGRLGPVDHLYQPPEANGRSIPDCGHRISWYGWCPRHHQRKGLGPLASTNWALERGPSLSLSSS
jgi:hypothetical protein